MQRSKNMSEQNEKLIETANEFVAAGNYEEFVKLCAEDVRWTMYSPGGTVVLDGREAIVEFMGTRPNASQAPPEFTITNTISDKSNVVTCGDMPMKEKDGSTGNYAFCDIYTIKNGEIAEFLTHMNRVDTEQTKDRSASA